MKMYRIEIAHKFWEAFSCDDVIEADSLEVTEVDEIELETSEKAVA